MFIRIMSFLLVWLAFTPAFADSAFVAPTATGTAATGQIPGTTTNDSANAGNVGEYKLSQTGGNFTAAITIATPAVISGTHTWSGVNSIVFSTTGALPTGITAGTVYFTSPSTVPNGSFNLSTTVDNAIAGIFITTTGSQSGTQTAGGLYAVTTTTVQNTQALSLSAGDWIVYFTAEYSPANTATVSAATAASISPTSGTLNGLVSGSISRAPAFVGDGQTTTLNVAPVHLSLASTTTYYGVFRGTFGVSTMSFVNGKMYAWRVR